MGDDIALQVEDLSKQYRLGEVGTGTLSHDLNRWWHRVMGKDDPYQQIGLTNDRLEKGAEYVWALKDVSFQVRKGEVLGIIGKNGAGKSTLLKLLSRITSPTTGSIGVNGRVASLLEVGTGFHPELTGRENIFLNGAILGMSKREIQSKLDEIVEFAGVEKYLDTPVKRYSSGMKVRLGFAVAAHLEPEILIVDEVLAVGDAEFQKKAIGKMKNVAETGERTVLFVSHNMGSIRSLCTRSLILDNGELIWSGSVEGAIQKYLTSSDRMGISKRNMNRPFFISSVSLKIRKEPSTISFTGGSLLFVLDYKNTADLKEVHISVVIQTMMGLRLTTASTSLLRKSISLTGQSGQIYCEFIDLPLNKGRYKVDVNAYRYSNGRDLIDTFQDAAEFTVEHGGNPYKSGMEQGEGIDVFSSNFKLWTDEN